MIRLRFSHGALSAGVFVATLAGCGGAPSPLAGPQALEPAGTRTSSSGSPLLYAAHDDRARVGLVSVLTFPQGKPFATIRTPGYPIGTCSDAAGNVWVVVEEPHNWNAYEYAHGGTTTIAKIHIPNPTYASGCAVDPTTGNLAVFTGVEEGSPGPVIDIWAGARKGRPAQYAMSFSPTAGAYDASGNLFIDGYIGSTLFFGFGELAKGSKAFATISVNARVLGYPGGVQWDGQYISVLAGNNRYQAIVFRLSVSGKVATVVGKVRLRSASTNFGPLFIQGRMAVATSGSKMDIVRLWSYPAGGAATQTIARFGNAVRGLTVSVAGSMR
jgi:hypothetical protein